MKTSETPFQRLLAFIEETVRPDRPLAKALVLYFALVVGFGLTVAVVLFVLYRFS